MARVGGWGMAWSSRIRGIVAGAVLGIALVARTAMANGLPVQEVRHPAGGLVPDDNTPVGVAHETLTFDFRGASPNGHVWLPWVTASYELENPSPVAQRLTVAFLYLDQAGVGGLPEAAGEGERGLVITWRGQSLPLEVTDPPAAVLEELRGTELHWLDPATGQRYAVHPVDAAGTIKAAVASLDIEPGGGGLLEVRFRQPYAGCDQCNRRLGKPIWHYTYLLRPARHWAHFGSLTIRVLAPGGMAVATEPALEPAGEGVWEKTFASLPPGDLHVSIRPPGVPWAPWAGLAVVAVAGAAAWVARGRLRHRPPGDGAGRAMGVTGGSHRPG